MCMKTALLSKISRAVIFCKEVLYVLQALSMVFVGNGYYPFRNARRAFLLAVIFRREVLYAPQALFLLLVQKK